ncbi:hypothetical protein [Hugenholtzia roseola]|uniref:hypothetical protein n=1 Tax=Hugenholtzia roseola TaxID=1002 RepID=UPI000412CADF|nr:hypothetical protein [Hugenholtzia roseola]
MKNNLPSLFAHSFAFFAKLWVCVLAFSFLSASTVFAQDDEWIEDPMGKPVVWGKLLDKPTDSTLWTQYMGKDWTAMSSSERDKVNNWKQELMLRSLASNEAVVGFVITEDASDGFFIDEAAFREFERQIEAAKNSSAYSTISFADMQGIEAVVMPEREGMAELKQNIAENFVIIEDLYKEIYEEQGLTYTYYRDKHPDGKYNQVKWIEDIEADLQSIKERQLKKLRDKYRITSSD